MAYEDDYPDSWKGKDILLVNLAKELNEKCLKRKEMENIMPILKANANANKHHIEHWLFNLHEWESYDLDYEINECRKYCFGNNYDIFEEYKLCDSCKMLLEEKIKKPFNKSKQEICHEIISLNTRIEKLEKQIQELLVNANFSKKI